jgi:hypothetical protein
VLTAAFWNTNVRDNSDALYQSIKRIGYQTRGTFGDGAVNFFTVSSTTFASSAEVFTDITWTADGTSAYIVEFFCPMVITGASADGIQVAICTGSGTNLGVVGEVYSTSGGVSGSPVHGRLFYTPAAGSASVNVRAKKASVNGALRFGGEYTPGYLAVYGANIT